MTYQLDKSLVQLNQLQEQQQQTFLECLTHNLLLIGQSIWLDLGIHWRQKQRYLIALSAIHHTIINESGEAISHSTLGDLIHNESHALPQLSEFIIEAIEESYQTALVA